jgi:hypothetical protein
MKAFAHYAALTLAIASFGVLAGCASAPDPETPAPLGAAATSRSDAQLALTGSRIPARRTEKMVSQVGGKDYRETAQAQPAPLQSN